MCTRWAAVVAILASLAGSAAAGPPEVAPVDDRPEPVDVEGLLAPRRVLPERSPTDPLTVRLVWLDPSHAAVGIESVARDETRSLLRKAGVTVEWRVGQAGEVARPGEVRAILADRAAARPSGEPILGSTPSHTEGQPFFWVHLPNVRAAMGLAPEGPLAALDASWVHALGVALGRVVAHEIVHVLAPSTPHGRGLMSEKLTRFQLTAHRLELEPQVGLAVRASLRGEPSLPPAGPDVLAATTSGGERHP